MNHDVEESGMATITLADIPSVVEAYFQLDEVNLLLNDMEKEYIIPKDTYIMIYKPLVTSMLQAYIQASGSDSAIIVEVAIEPFVTTFVAQPMIQATSTKLATSMTEAKMQSTILTKVGELTGKLVETMASAMQVDPSMIAQAFTFDLSEDELGRLMSAMASTSADKTAYTNLILCPLYYFE